MKRLFRRRHRSRHRTAHLSSAAPIVDPAAPTTDHAEDLDLTTPSARASASDDALLTTDAGECGAGTVFSSSDTGFNSAAAGFGWTGATGTAFDQEHMETPMSAEETNPGNAEQPSTRLGKNSRISRNLSFEGTVLIEGHVEGEINTRDSILIGETAVVNAELTASSVVITGNVTGDITALRRVEIRAPGRVYGKVTTPSLIIHEGVVFDGQCLMSGVETKQADHGSPPPPAKNGGKATGGSVKVDSEVEW